MLLKCSGWLYWLELSLVLHFLELKTELHITVQDQERKKIKKMAKSPLRTDLELLGRLTSKNPLLPLPDPKQRNPQIAHAPKRNHGLSTAEKKVCVKKLEKLNDITILSKMPRCIAMFS